MPQGSTPHSNSHIPNAKPWPAGGGAGQEHTLRAAKAAIMSRECVNFWSAGLSGRTSPPPFFRPFLPPLPPMAKKPAPQLHRSAHCGSLLTGLRNGGSLLLHPPAQIWLMVGSIAVCGGQDYYVVPAAPSQWPSGLGLLLIMAFANQAKTPHP